MGNGVFSLVVAVLPLAAYFLLIGGMRLVHPLVTTNARDGAALAVAVGGLVMVGPMQLFFPAEAAATLGWIVWLVLLVLYLLCVTLLLLSIKPKIMVYGVRMPGILEALLEACKTIDATATLDVTRQQIELAERGVRLRVEALGLSDAVQIEAFEQNLHPRFWHHLLLELRKRVTKQHSGFSFGGLGMLVVGLLLISIVIGSAVSQPDALVAGFRSWLQL